MPRVYGDLCLTNPVTGIFSFESREVYASECCSPFYSDGNNSNGLLGVGCFACIFCLSFFFFFEDFLFIFYFLFNYFF